MTATPEAQIASLPVPVLHIFPTGAIPFDSTKLTDDDLRALVLQAKLPELSAKTFRRWVYHGETKGHQTFQMPSKHLFVRTATDCYEHICSYRHGCGFSAIVWTYSVTEEQTYSIW